MNKLIIFAVIILILPIASATQARVSIHIEEPIDYTQDLLKYIEVMNTDSQARDVLKIINSDNILIRLYDDSHLYLYEVKTHNNYIYSIKSTNNMQDADTIISFELSKFTQLLDSLENKNYIQAVKIAYKHAELPIRLKVRISLYLLRNNIKILLGV